MGKAIDTPQLSVIMSVYNGERYLKEAIDSILLQTYKAFELIIINDGSTDTTEKIIQSYKDKRIRLINQENRGLVASLNTGIKHSAGKYIARHDADDVSLPTRIEKQIKFLEFNTKVVAVGSSMKVMDESSKVLHAHFVLLSDPELRQELFIRSPFAHGSVMFRKEAAIKAGLYKQSFWPAEDYEFWLRLSCYGLLANLNEPLYIYRESTESISGLNHSKQQEQVSRIQEVAWEQKDLLIGKRIRLNQYLNLEGGHERVERILKNTTTIYKKALLEKNHFLAVKILRVLFRNPILYRKIAGTIKRKVKRV